MLMLIFEVCLQDEELDQLDEEFSDIGDFDNTNMMGSNDALDTMGFGQTTDSQDQVSATCN